MGILYNCYTMHNSTHSVHKRLLKVWRARLLRLWPSCYSLLLHCPEPTASLSPSWWAGPPSFQDGSLFPRIHTHPLPNVRYKNYVKSWCCLVLGQTVHPHSVFWRSVPLKGEEKNHFEFWISFSAFAKYMEWNLAYADDTRNEIEHIWITHWISAWY